MNTNDLILFIRTADSGSITNAAQQLDISTATASAAIKRLEKTLNTQLFIRTTRQLRLTLEGERYINHCRQALETLALGKKSIQSLQGELAGEIRLSAPSDLSRNILIPWLDEIMEQHPKLSLHLRVGDTLTDFYLDRIDIALRYGTPEDSNMIAFNLANFERVLCASPSYLAIHDRPQQPSDLSNHNCLIYQLNSRAHDTWSFIDQNQKVIKVKVHSDRYCNDGDIVRRWVIAGRGIAYKSRIDMLRDLRLGTVVQLLPDFHSESVELNLICPTRKQVTPAALLLRDRLREKFRELSEQ